MLAPILWGTVLHDAVYHDAVPHYHQVFVFVLNVLCFNKFSRNFWEE